MNTLLELYHSIYFNFFSFGSLLATAFMFVCGVFLFRVPKMQRSTFHLGIAYIFFSIFYFAYFVAAMFYHPLAAYHRWFTVCIMLFAEIHVTQWFLRFPRNTHPKTARMFYIIQYLITFVLMYFFITKTLQSEKIFYFNGHYWDFQAEGISYTISLVIFLYILIMIPVSIWRMYLFKGQERIALLKVLIGVLVGAIVPALANSQSRDGLIERGTYLNLLVVILILGFFYVIIVYLNNTKERTSFMAKIIGITMVTFLIMMQGISMLVMKEKEIQYDAIRLENMERALEGGKKNKNISYVLETKYDSPGLVKTDYDAALDLREEHIRIDLLNSIIYEEILLLPEDNFKEELNKLLSITHDEFRGYHDAIVHFIEINGALDNKMFKENLIEYFENLNKVTFYDNNKINLMEEDSFCTKIEKTLSKLEENVYFRNVIMDQYRDCKWREESTSLKEVRFQMVRYIRPFQPASKRHFRKSMDDSKHFVAYGKYYPETKTIKEVGFNYLDYREYMHTSSKMQKLIMAAVLFVIIVIYPFFFKGSLSTPLLNLLAGVRRVNKGHLDVKVPVRVEDEIGYITNSFNKMVKSIHDSKQKLEEYANTLEEKVEERTRELQVSLTQVENLKTQQDGDYFLTTLLLKPLSVNAVEDSKIKVDFFIKQKKEFKFRSKQHDIGGDICISQQIRLKGKKYISFLNADAMGKSIQGAGGVLVLGAVYHSIIQRTHSYQTLSEVYPEQWIKSAFKEMHKIFESFNGSMLISMVFGLIEESTGLVYFINAEHPWIIAYEDKKASFIENDLSFRKLGTSGVENDLYISTYQMKPGTLLIMGSDGKDDLVLNVDEKGDRTINEDESLFLKRVEEAGGDLNLIFKLITQQYELMDDFSLLSLYYPESDVKIGFDELNEQELIFKRAKSYFRRARYEDAIAILQEGHKKYEENSEILNLLIRCYIKLENYKEAAGASREYLRKYEIDTSLMFKASYCLKKNLELEEAIDLSERVKLRQPANVRNLIHLADMYAYMKNYKRANKIIKKIFKLEPENESAIKIYKLINGGE